MPTVIEIRQTLAEQWTTLSRSGSPAQKLAWLKKPQAALVLPRQEIQAHLKNLQSLHRRLYGHATARRQRPGIACSRAIADAAWFEGRPIPHPAACRCDGCQSTRRYPAHYAPRGLAYECYLERLVEEAEDDLPGIPPSVGSVICERRARSAMVRNQFYGSQF